MKKAIFSIALSGLLAFGACGVMATAQDAPAQDNSMQGQGGGGHRGGWGNPDEMLAHMTKRYSLTSDQQSQIKPILESQQQQMQTLRANTSMSRQDKMAQMQSIHQDSSQKIEAVLNDSQKQKFEADQAKMQQRRQEHMQNGGGSGAISPQ